MNIPLKTLLSGLLLVTAILHASTGAFAVSPVTQRKISRYLQAGAPACPETVRQARFAATAEVTTFKKRRPTGTWIAFVRQFRHKYGDCSRFVMKTALANARREFFAAKVDKMRRW